MNKDRHGDRGREHRHSDREHRHSDRDHRHDRGHEREHRHSDRDRERERETRERDRDRRSHNNNNQPVATTNRETLKAAISEMTTLLIEEEAFFIGKETGRLMRWGELEGLGVLEPVQPEFQIVEAPGVDIFGEPLAKKHIFECVCPRCHRTLAAQRFAPHLEKCMGMGRNSSRIASRRLAEGSSSQTSQNGNGAAASSTKGNDKPCSQTGNNASGSVAVAAGGTQQNGEAASEEEHFEEDEDDEDWTMERKRKHTKKGGLEKISPKSRKGPLQRIRHAEGSRGRRGASPSVTDSPMSVNEGSMHEDDDEFASLNIG